jgi:hypothetical protein
VSIAIHCNMPYQGVVLPILLGVGLAVAAIFYFVSQGNSPSPHSNRSRNTSSPSFTGGVPSWELG